MDFIGRLVVGFLRAAAVAHPCLFAPGSLVQDPDAAARPGQLAGGVKMGPATSAPSGSVRIRAGFVWQLTSFAGVCWGRQKRKRSVATGAQARRGAWEPCESSAKMLSSMSLQLARRSSSARDSATAAYFRPAAIAATHYDNGRSRHASGRPLKHADAKYSKVHRDARGPRGARLALRLVAGR